MFCAPLLWNNLPADIRQSGSTEGFKSKLKTYFFQWTASYFSRSVLVSLSSCSHVIVCNHFIPFFKGSQGLLLEPITVANRGQVASSSQGPQEQFGVQYLAQGHFNIQLSSAQGSWDLKQRPSDHLTIHRVLPLRNNLFIDIAFL